MIGSDTFQSWAAIDKMHHQLLSKDYGNVLSINITAQGILSAVLEISFKTEHVM